jgi:hypothetical protein
VSCGGKGRKELRPQQQPSGHLSRRSGVRLSLAAVEVDEHPDLFKVLIREIGQHRKADIVLGKALGVLPEAELSSQSATCCIAIAPPDYRASPARIG